MRITFAILALAASLMTAQGAKPIDDAKALYNSGQYEQAVAKLNAILKSTPKDGTANYYLGLSRLALGQSDAAVAPLRKAADRGVADAWRRLAEMALDDYAADDASDYLAEYEAALRKAKKSTDEADALRSRVVMVKNMLARVEKIAIVDSIVVDKEDFFKHYSLSPEAGRLLSGDIIAREYSDAAPAVVYVPQSNREIFWAMGGGETPVEIYSSQVLDDGSFESPKALDSSLGEGGDADYPFFASDGMTFYFANNGENSLGGYDIFLSRRDPDGSVLNPQNIGMPYNSPYDDYMLVIDEASNRGWWATDRNQIPGKVTIYEFVPNETRINYEDDDPNIADYAFVRNIAATREDIDIKPAAAAELVAQAPIEFHLSLGNGRVYTRLADFRKRQARETMEQYLQKQRELSLMQARLSNMRRQYAGGDKTVGSDILSLEKRVAAARQMLQKLQNQVISQEIQ